MFTSTAALALAEKIGARLMARQATLATAESCTGGLIGDLVTSVPGASAYYQGGVIAYSNDVKQALLGVRAVTLDTQGAVSEACVREMAEGARARLGVDFSVAVSGIAGPGGGAPEKPVGLVHFAVAGPQGTVTHHVICPGGRGEVKQRAAFIALDLLEKELARSEVAK